MFANQAENKYKANVFGKVYTPVVVANCLVALFHAACAYYSTPESLQKDLMAIVLVATVFFLGLYNVFRLCNRGDFEQKTIES